MSAATAPSPRLYHRTQTRPNLHPTQVNPRGDLATPLVLLGASVDLSIERCDQVFQVLALLLQLCKPGLVGQRLCWGSNVFWNWNWTNLLGCELSVQASRNTFACLNSFGSQNDQKSWLHCEDSWNGIMKRCPAGRSCISRLCSSSSTDPFSSSSRWYSRNRSKRPQRVWTIQIGFSGALAGFGPSAVPGDWVEEWSDGDAIFTGRSRELLRGAARREGGELRAIGPTKMRCVGGNVLRKERV
jgi:hypothetical protein